MAHRGHATYIFISRDKSKISRDKLRIIYRAIILNLSRNKLFFIARYKNVGSMSSMGHRMISYLTNELASVLNN